MQLITQIKNLLSMFSVKNYILFAAVIILLILIISLIYLLKNSKYEENDTVKLKKMTEKIIKEHKPTKTNFTEFEKEQEEKSIISYQELVDSNKDLKINYIEETNVDGLIIKKVDSSELFTE